MTIPEFAYADIDVGKIVLVMAQSGLTNDEIAVAIGMTPSKFKNMLDKYPDFREVLNEAKEEPNAKVEQALFKRALGYDIKETVKKDGKPVQVTLKSIAPDPVSCIFWLKNRSPKRWKDTIEMKHTLADRMGRAHDAIAERSRGMIGSGDGVD